MKNAVQLYGRYLGVSIRSQMQYRASFVMMAFARFFLTGIEFLAIAVLFARFGNIEGWTLPEVAILYGMVSISFAIADAASRGFDLFGTTVKSGEFDRLLLRPRNTALQLAGQELTLRRVGRLLQGMVILVWADTQLELSLSPEKITLLFFALLGGACLFISLMVLQATLAFWTTESLEIMNTVTYGGVETTQYPLAIYRPWFRKFFIYVIPLGCVNYFPALAILGRTDPLGYPEILQWLAPLLGLTFLYCTLQIWKFGVRHYISTGS